MHNPHDVPAQLHSLVAVALNLSLDVSLFLHSVSTASSGLPRTITINSGSTHVFFSVIATPYAIILPDVGRRSLNHALLHGFPRTKIQGIKG